MKSFATIAYRWRRPPYWENGAKLVLSQLDHCAVGLMWLISHDLDACFWHTSPKWRNAWQDHVHHWWLVVKTEACVGKADRIEGWWIIHCYHTIQVIMDTVSFACSWPSDPDDYHTTKSSLVQLAEIVTKYALRAVYFILNLSIFIKIQERFKN